MKENLTNTIHYSMNIEETDCFPQSVSSTYFDKFWLGWKDPVFGKKIVQRLATAYAANGARFFGCAFRFFEPEASLVHPAGLALDQMTESATLQGLRAMALYLRF